jgi:hypothetical protein
MSIGQWLPVVGGLWEGGRFKGGKFEGGKWLIHRNVVVKFEHHLYLPQG